MKRIIIALLITSICINLIGCGSKNNQIEDASNENESTTQIVSKYDRDFKFDPPIDVTTIKVADTAANYPEGEDAQSNGVYNMIKETLGINFVNKIECAPAAYEEKIKLSVISNSLPDIGMVPKDMMDMLIKNDMVMDLTPVIEEYGSPTTKDVFHFNNDILLKTVKRDEKVYGFPMACSIYSYIPLLWIRQDWLNNLNLEAPKTMEEVIEIAKAFANDDPDRNNKNDTYGLALTKELFGSNTALYSNLMNAYGVYPRAWVKNEEGKLINGSADPNAKKVLKILQDLYKEKVIDPEFAVKNLAKLEEDIAAEKYGMYFGLFFHPLYPLYNSYLNEPESDWTPYVLPPAEDEDTCKFYMPLNISGYVYVRKGYEHPEAAIALINGELDPNSPFGEGWAKLNDVPEYRGLSYNNWLPFSCTLPDNNDGIQIKNYLDKNIDPVKEKLPVNKAAWDIIVTAEDGDPQKWAYEKIMLDAYLKLDKLNLEDFVYDEYVGPPTQTQAKIQSILYQKEEETIMKIIMGNEEVSAYDEYIKNWYDLGGTQVLEEINQKINNN